MKYAAGITFYYPQKKYIENAIELSKSFDYVFIQDNSPKDFEEPIIFKEYNNIIYLKSGNNEGLPAAFNKFINLCQEYAVDVLGTFDQDSVIKKEEIRLVKKYIENTKEKKWAIYAVTPIEKDRYLVPKTVQDITVLPVEWVICSGSFLNISIIEKNSILYDEKYYIDRFDQDFCKQLRNCKLLVMKFTNLFMYHECGESGKHNLLRNYYMFRNRRYYNDKYYPVKISKIRTSLQDARHVFNLVYRQKVDLETVMKIRKKSIEDYENGLMGVVADTFIKRINYL